jgi:hypothetical protein
VLSNGRTEVAYAGLRFGAYPNRKPACGAERSPFIFAVAQQPYQSRTASKSDPKALTALMETPVMLLSAACGIGIKAS